MHSNPLSEDLDHILEHTRDLWVNLQGERLFITGGTGFFGCWLLESFTWAVDRLGLNTQAIVLSRKPDRFVNKAPHLANHASVQLWVGDVRSFDYPDGHFTHVIHAATESGGNLNEQNPLLMLDTIVNGTRRTLDFAQKRKANNFLYVSSGAVYGKQPPEMTHIPEDYIGGPDPIQPRSSYGEGKRVGELLCSLYAREYGLPTKIARCFAFVGPYLPLNIHFAIGNFIRDGLRGDPIRINGDGTPYRSYLYSADLAIWLWTILFKGKAIRPYNVGSEDTISIAKLADQVANNFSPRTIIHAADHPSSKTPNNRYVPSTSRARQELNLQQLIELDDAIRKTMRWHIELNQATYGIHLEKINE